ncbi:uracil permease [Cadophora sp. MPI-SDFR-AT-0126]|nr:uracil permease [Leotiomycetes sp. MPI-SDFR-AT-0126]
MVFPTLRLPAITLPENDAVKARFTSIKSWECPKQESSIAPPGVWSNADQDPVLDVNRTWSHWAFTGYWMSDLVTVATWQVGSSILIVGLSSKDALLIMLVAGICNAIATVLNGAIGADLRIPFPIAVRASYGYWFSYFCVVSRAILAAFWLGVQSVGGGSAVTSAITCIWPSYAKLPNHLPVSAHITTQAMCSYFLFHIIQFPFLLIPTYKLQKLFLVKSIVVPPMAIGILIWICVKAHGSNAILSQPATISGSVRAWAWLSAMTSITGGFSTLTVNIPDFARFSKSRKSQWSQLPVIPILKVVTALFGIIATGAARVVYPGEDIWSPFGLIAKWEGSGGRFLGFVCACLWILAQVCCNISANSVSFANDVTTLCPRWINIKRGTILCSIIGGWALVPWLMVSSASVFLNFMSGYAVFLGPMAGIMTADYWIVRRGRYDIADLYDPKGRYYFWKGINWRAFLANAIPIAPLLVGLAYSISPTVHIGVGLKHLYAISWLFGYPTSIALYSFFSYVSPPTASMVSETAGLSETIETFERGSVDIENISGGSSAPSMVKRGEKGMTVDENRLN